jgi:hypothetical protein
MLTVLYQILVVSTFYSSKLIIVQYLIVGVSLYVIAQFDPTPFYTDLFAWVFGVVAATLCITYIFKGLFFITYVFMFKMEESRANLIELYNHLPDALFVLKTSKIMRDSPLMHDKEVSSGDVGATHFELLYCNQ